MSQKTPQKQSPLRLPSELLVELRKEQAPYLQRGKEAPSFGSLLLGAWRSFKSIQKQEPSAEISVAHPEHTRWHSLLDYILEYGTEDDKTGIQKNLEWGANDVQSHGGKPLLEHGNPPYISTLNTDLEDFPPGDSVRKNLEYLSRSSPTLGTDIIALVQGVVELVQSGNAEGVRLIEGSLELVKNLNRARRKKAKNPSDPDSAKNT
jgi:hypothetical protein